MILLFSSDFVHLMTQEGIGPDSQLVSRKVSIPLAGVCGISLRKSHGMSVLQASQCLILLTSMLNFLLAKALWTDMSFGSNGWVNF